jgi:hypothetical protein
MLSILPHIPSTPTFLYYFNRSQQVSLIFTAYPVFFGNISNCLFFLSIFFHWTVVPQDNNTVVEHAFVETGSMSLLYSQDIIWEKELGDFNERNPWLKIQHCLTENSDRKYVTGK